MATSTPARANSPANIRPVGPAPTIKTSATGMVLPPPPFATAFSRPRPHRRDEHAHVSEGHKLRANRSCAILELPYFGSISVVGAPISIQLPQADAAEQAAWR